MDMVWKKRRNRRGETFAEVLVAMLVIGLSTCLLAGMVQTALSIDGQMRQADSGPNGFYPALARAEAHTFDPGADTPITVKTTGGPVEVVFSDTYCHVEQSMGKLSVYGKGG